MNMICNKLKIILLISVLLLGVVKVNIADATIVDLNALSNTTSNPVSLFLTAGTYDIDVIGIADGGAYNAWNPWAYWNNPYGCDSAGANCTNGWVNDYSLSSSEFAPVTYSDGNRYATSSLALANAINSSFMLTLDTTVDFFISDNPYWDNSGGISLSVNSAPVPEPSTMILFSSGFLGLLLWKRREIRDTI